MIDRLFKLVAPHRCLNCRQTGAILCQRCNNHILNQPRPTGRCLVCQQPSPAGLCPTHQLSVERAFWFGHRRGLLRRLIDDYKFKLHRELAPILANLLSEVIDSDHQFVVIPLPTTRRHNRERGFDHMRLVARHLACQRGWTVAPVLRHAHQISQRGLKRADRLKNAQNMFICKRQLDPNQHYLVIDDVFTTGASLTAAVEAVRQAGAKHISVAILARQPDKTTV